MLWLVGLHKTTTAAMAAAAAAAAKVEGEEGAEDVQESLGMRARN